MNYVGQQVRLNVPENPRLHDTLASVRELTEWGALLDAPAAATGQFRALHSEMAPVGEGRDSGYTGDPCDLCGSMKVRRSGTCLLCDNCGTTTGC